MTQATLVPVAPAAPPARQESEALALLAMIERVARDPTVDIARVQALLDMRLGLEERQSRREFDAAFAAMQAELPATLRRGRARVEKDGRLIRETAYPRWEDICDDISPILARHGFGLSFRVSNGNGTVSIAAVLSHAGGHREETTPLVLPVDNTGSKNAVQAIGSSTSYGKRYTAGSLLNLTSRDEDDDGAGGREEPELVSEEQIANLREMVESYGIKLDGFCRYLRVNKLGDLPASRYQEAVNAAQLKAPKR